MELMPFTQARERAIARVVPICEVETIALTAALGRVLATSIIAPENVPNHDNTAMDGYAVRFQDLEKTSETTLRIDVVTYGLVFIHQGVDLVLVR